MEEDGITRVYAAEGEQEPAVREWYPNQSEVHLSSEESSGIVKTADVIATAPTGDIEDPAAATPAQRSTWAIHTVNGLRFAITKPSDEPAQDAEYLAKRLEQTLGKTGLTIVAW